MNNTIFIFLDDCRTPPQDYWTLVYTAPEAYELLLKAHKNGNDIILSLDHDLGEDIPTGYDLLNWLEKDIVINDDFRPRIIFRIHSANPVGRDNMQRAINAINKRLQS